jgi:glycolate oxidase iron-sulfur subunit
VGSGGNPQSGKDGALTTTASEAPSFEKIAACVHCGLCLEACPTYRELRVEMDSPRGRIYLMKGILQNRLTPSETVLEHLDRCLDCRACETACPSGVEYGLILEKTRSVLQPARKLSPLGRLIRWFALTVLLPSRSVQWAVWKLLWLQQALGLLALARWLGRRGLLPRRLAAAAAQAPRVPLRSFRSRREGEPHPDGDARVFPARGDRRHRVAFFTGCLADQMFAGVNAATVRVLTENGCEVHVLGAEVCCGALHIHNGARDGARALARTNVRVFGSVDDVAPYDAIISNAAGCSAELRHYGNLLEGDGDGYDAARSFAARIRDISEYLVEIGWKRPTAPGQLTGKLAYAEPCHLVHAQKISAQPRALLADIPGLTPVPLDEAETCCGSAGAYSLLQPVLSQAVSARKIDAIRRSGANVVATGNPGCLLQIAAGVRAAGLHVAVVHPVQLLASAYERSR